MNYNDITDDISLSSVLTRDPKYILGLLEETKDDRIIVKKPLDVIYPENYLTKKLAKLDQDLTVLGIVALVDPQTNKYAVLSIPGMITIPITEMKQFTYQEDVYRVLSLDAYDTLVLNTNIVKDETLDYYMYLNYLDILNIYSKDSYYIGQNLIDIPQVLEMLLANIARDPKNDKFMYRDKLKSMDDIKTNPPSWVPLRNVSLGSVDTYSKLMGSYFEEGLTSALADKSKKMTRIEKVLRS